MTKIQSSAQKKRWAKVSKKKRSEIMRAVARKKWAQISKRKRKLYSQKLHAAKKKKQ